MTDTSTKKSSSTGSDDSAYESSRHSSQSSNDSTKSDDSTTKLIEGGTEKAEETKSLPSVIKGESTDDSDCKLMSYDDPEIGVKVNKTSKIHAQCVPSARLTYILVGIAVVLSLTTLVVTIVAAQQTSRQQRQPLTFPETCVPCIKLILNPYEPYASDPVLDILDKKLTNGIQMCCATTAAQMSAMLECGLRDQITRPLPAPEESKSLKFVPASLHKKLLPLDPESESTVICGEHCHLSFNPDFHDSTEHVRGVEVEKSAITIKYTGLYYIYTTIHFSVKSAPTSVNDQSIFQYVERIRPNSPANTGLLLQNSHTTCIGCSKDEETAFTGGVFYLMQGDILHICVTNRAAHDENTGLSNFGLIMLSSDEKP